MALACTESNESRIALGLCLVFLDKLLLCETSVPVANFDWVSNLDESAANENNRLSVDPQDKQKGKVSKNMIIDA